MNLETTYFNLKQLIDNLDFSKLWAGFRPLKFALYNEDQCFFNGHFIHKTDIFMANTSIQYQGEYIAIWNLTQEVDLEVLASKIIHEMFHGYQMSHQESRFPNELEALLTYRYSKENLSIKLAENNLLEQLIVEFDQLKFNKLLALRAYRLVHFPNEYQYESAIEQIEGTASFVELNALLQINPDKYQNKMKAMIAEITEPMSFFPIRVLSYSVGALIFLVLKRHQLNSFECFADQAVTTSMLKNIPQHKGDLPIFPEISKLVETYNNESSEIIKETLSANQCVLDGDYKLLALNVYDARYYKGYIITTHFLMFQDNNSSSVLKGDFVISLNSDNRIHQAYKI